MVLTKKSKQGQSNGRSSRQKNIKVHPIIQRAQEVLELLTKNGQTRRLAPSISNQQKQTDMRRFLMKKRMAKSKNQQKNNNQSLLLTKVSTELHKIIDNTRSRSKTTTINPICTFSSINIVKPTKISSMRNLSRMHILVRGLTEQPLPIYNVNREACVYCHNLTYVDPVLAQRFCVEPGCSHMEQVVFNHCDNTIDHSLAGASTLVATQHIDMLSTSSASINTTTNNDKILKVGEAIKLIVPGETLPVRCLEVAIPASIKTKNNKKVEPLLSSDQAKPIDKISSKVVLYKKFLLQFSVDNDDNEIPEDVFACIYNYLSNVHVHTLVRARPTPIATILRKNGFRQYANSALKISLLFNGEQIPEIPVKLIDRLVERYKVINTTCISLGQPLISQEFLTPVLLRLELRPDIAEIFRNHRTRQVLTGIDDRMVKMLPAIIEHSPHDLKWQHFTRCC